ncbi:hypothetical protein BH18ACI2_BH18ACI2_27290 [soil metagenome]
MTHRLMKRTPASRATGVDDCGRARLRIGTNGLRIAEPESEISNLTSRISHLKFEISNLRAGLSCVLWTSAPGALKSQARHHLCLLLAAFFIGGCAVGTHAQTTRPAVPSQAEAEVLTNTSVVKLVRARFSDKTIIAIIRARPSRFDLAPDHLIDLKKTGVSERVILEMLARSGEEVMVADDSASDSFDDPFFDDMKNSSRRPDGTNGSGSDPGETNIFGSNSGGRSKTRSKIGNGGNEGETQTTGSASVRIIRPPAEAGGAPPKLERTPTLTNDSIIELVDAGFSEGTIIRRIEAAPANYDFAPAKLAELRRRRVTDPIINAMRAAMGEDVSGQTNGTGGAPENN